MHPKLLEMKSGNLLVEMLWKDIDLILVEVTMAKELDLCDDLIGK